MLDLVEKIAAGICGFLVLVTLAWYAWVGTPSTTATEFVPNAEKIQDKPPPETGKAAEQPVSPEEQAIIDKLAQQGRKLLPGQKLAKDEYRVPEKTFEVISAQANWIPELKKLNHRKIKVNGHDTRIEIFDIQENSLLHKLGLQEKDVIELLDGQIVEFNDASTTKYAEMFKSASNKLRQGQPVSVTVTRNNKPLHLEFRL